LEVGLKSKLVQNYFSEKFKCEDFGELKRFSLTFKNPLGVAAGFDKNGRVVNGLPRSVSDLSKSEHLHLNHKREPKSRACLDCPKTKL
jgi:hypothetical protein